MPTAPALRERVAATRDEVATAVWGSRVEAREEAERAVRLAAVRSIILLEAFYGRSLCPSQSAQETVQKKRVRSARQTIRLSGIPAEKTQLGTRV